MSAGTLPSGPLDAITDVAGVRVGSVTLISGDGALRRGVGPVRTGVTVVVPRDGVAARPVFAGSHTLNGNGEVTGLAWLGESGLLSTPVALTNTHSVGVVRDALVAASLAEHDAQELRWSLPVVGETWDGLLNDVNGFHVRPEHVGAALDRATGGPVAEGGVGGGTGMVCHGFKGGLGTSSRTLPSADGGWTLGVLVQANHGRRERLTVAGVPVGRVIGADVVPPPIEPGAGTAGPAGTAALDAGAAGTAGSIIAVCATDAPLLPHQCRRLAQRCTLGIARTGGVGEHSSGDFALAFSTAGPPVPPADAPDGGPLTVDVAMVADNRLDPLFAAAVDATEDAIVNALLAGRTMTGRDGITAVGLGAERLLAAMRGLGWSGW